MMIVATLNPEKTLAHSIALFPFRPMAARSPRKNSDGAMDSIWPDLVKPIPPSVVQFVSNYDVSGIGKMLSALGDLSFDEKMEAFKNNLESFKKPKPHEALLDEYYDDEDYEDDEDDEDDDEVLMMGDEKKSASDVELQVPTEGERECKKPRLSESFECQGQREEIEVAGTK